MRICSINKKRIAALALALAILCMPASAFAEQDKPDEAEERLRLLGFYYPLEGEDESGLLYNAVYIFQKANGMEPTGVLDEETERRLMSADAISLASYMADGQTDLSFGLKDSGKGVKNLQKALSDLGYYSGETSGEYSLETACAVALFETVNGFEPDGLADSAVLSRLLSPAAVPLAGFEEWATLSEGDSGVHVKYAQMILKDQGYYDGEISGVFGSATRDAVMDFERRNSLSVTGAWQILYTVRAKNNLAVSKSDALAAEAANDLKQDDEGYRVRELKERLYCLGYFDGLRDEVFDERLSLALMNFQEANGLEMSGVADAETRAKLASEDCVDMAAFEKVCETMPLREGQTGYGVYLMTRRLQALDYPIAASRVYDSAVAEAVGVFRYAQGLDAGDFLSEEDRQLMNSTRALHYADAKPLADEKRAQDEFEQGYLTFIGLVRETVGKPYEPGISGPDSFGVGGFTQYCYGLIGIELAPKATLQLENAREESMLTDDINRVNGGSQLFFREGEQLYTGIVTDEGKLIYASPSRGEVIETEVAAILENYEFAGLVVYFYAP